MFENFIRWGSIEKHRAKNLEEVRDDVTDDLIGFCVKDLETNVAIPKSKQYINEWKELNPGVDHSSVIHEVEFKYGYDRKFVEATAQQYIFRVEQGSYSGVLHESATLSAKPPPKKAKRVFVSVETPVSEEPAPTEEPPGRTRGFSPLESTYQTVEQLVNG